MCFRKNVGMCRFISIVYLVAGVANFAVKLTDFTEHRLILALTLIHIVVPIPMLIATITKNYISQRVYIFLEMARLMYNPVYFAFVTMNNDDPSQVALLKIAFSVGYVIEIVFLLFALSFLTELQMTVVCPKDSGPEAADISVTNSSRAELYVAKTTANGDGPNDPSGPGLFNGKAEQRSSRSATAAAAAQEDQTHDEAPFTIQF